MGDQNSAPINQAMDLDSLYNHFLTGKFVISCLLVLYVLVLFFVIIIYSYRQHMLNRQTPIFNVNLITVSRGLDPKVRDSLPIFTYKSSSKTDQKDDVPECAVCLSEFEENDTGRLLPNCNHRFHTECIDMWFYSHSTCPLCRLPVKTDTRPTEVKVAVGGESSSIAAPEATSQAGGSSTQGMSSFMQGEPQGVTGHR